MSATLVKTYLLGLQARIVAALEEMEGQPFRHDEWQRPAGGGGITRIIEGGELFERAGVGFSHVMGDTLPASASAHRPELAGRAWEAMGVSLVFHPRNPYVPTVHMNVRLFRAMAEGCADVFWVGGGLDLTPYYGFVDDAVHFHAHCRDALAKHGDYYPKFKRWCDDYFYLKHRQEPRGIGGIFFDDFSELGEAGSIAMLQSVGDSLLPAYLPIVERRRNMAYGAHERDWQAYRRGRYVEFNLVWDRGTLFGLQSGGRTESILMSMPPAVNWRYDYQPEPGSPEAALSHEFLIGRDWLA